MRKRKKRTITGFGIAMLFVLAFAVFFRVNFTQVVVQGPSMLPTLREGQRVLVTKAYWLVGALKDKDIVVMTDTGPTGYMIKRIHAMSGEQVDLASAPRQHSILQSEGGGYTVPAGHIYVIGDNRPKSQDSRDFGPLPEGRVLGKVVVFP